MSYSELYDRDGFEGYLSEKEFLNIMDTINCTLFNYFPCPMCLCLGYFLALPTLGLSFLMPNVCVRDAEEQLQNFIKRAQKKKLADKNLELVLRKKCGTSWLEFRKIGPPTLTNSGEVRS